MVDAQNIDFDRDVVQSMSCATCMEISKGENTGHMLVSITIDNEMLVSCQSCHTHLAVFPLKDDVVTGLIEKGCDCCREEGTLHEQ
tara:strand:+ start:534 stop:791 length:258 start_codon:yes stop_codon:yes gene_type:complete